MSQTRSAEAVATALEYEDELLATLELPSGKLDILRGLGSGSTRRCGDPEGTFWAVGDRGPNIKIKVAVGTQGLEHLAEHVDLDGAKVMPCPDIGPAISELRLAGDKVVLVQTIPLRDRSGKPLSGLPAPGSAVALAEPAFTLDGTRIPGDPSGADTAGIVACQDDIIFVSDELDRRLCRTNQPVERAGSGTDHRTRKMEQSLASAADIRQPMTAGP